GLKLSYAEKSVTEFAYASGTIRWFERAEWLGAVSNLRRVPLEAQLLE
ncbi:hypothetical protein A2U01_0108433, partial [Trifolium medium]|nr:hypothetical protein [Trifolium medium]